MSYKTKIQQGPAFSIDELAVIRGAAQQHRRPLTDSEREEVISGIYLEREISAATSEKGRSLTADEREKVVSDFKANW